MSVMKIEYTKMVGGFIETSMVALFDESAVTEEEVKEIIQTCEEHKHVAMMSKDTYESVFRSLIKKEEENETCN